MPKVLPLPRKQRTRQHVIADLGVNHVERFVFEAGFTAERVYFDYGYDLMVTTFDQGGYTEPERIPVQVKASEWLRANSQGSHLVIDITIEDYYAWTQERCPVILMAYCASRRHAFWVAIQQYFSDNPRRRPRQKAEQVRILIPKSRRINRKSVELIRRLKNNAYGF